MEEQSVNVFQELTNFQSKIEFLFRDLMNERNRHKLNLEESKRNVEKLSIEVSGLKKHNRVLKQSNEELKNILIECFKLFRNLDLSGQSLNQNNEHVVDMLQNSFTKMNRKMEDLPSGELDVKIKIEYHNMENETKIEDITSRLKFDEEVIKKEIESISKLNFSTQFFQDDEMNKKNELISNKSKPESISGKVFEWKPHQSEVKKEKKVEEPLARETRILLTNSYHLNKPDEVSYTAEHLTQRQGFCTPEKSCAGSRSPVFKDLGNRKQDADEENSNDASKPSSSKLVNEKYLLRNSDLIISPLKRPSSEIDSSPSPKRGSSAQKRCRMNSRSLSSSQLKKLFFTEAEISPTGVRKFTQTRLNIECFKKKSPEKKKDVYSIENEAVGDKREAVVDENKLVVDVEEDDVIYESPKNPGQMLEGLGEENKSKKEHFLNSTQFLTPFSASDGADLDETYVSYSLVKKCKLPGKHMIEDRTTPSKRSPEYDSVPFIYKQEPVRKKAERMKLLGHTCLGCQKYYVEALGSDMNSQDLQEVLNKCSRHRDRNLSSVDNTPPGYWKPYLTASNIISPGKNEPVTQ